MESYTRNSQTASAEAVAQAALLLRTSSSPLAAVSSGPIASVKYKWIRPRLWAGIATFWLVSGLGAGLMELAGYPSSAEGWRILVLFVSVLLCMATGRWRTWLRVSYVLVVPLFLRVFLELPIVVLTAPGLYVFGRENLIDPLATFLASLPILVLAMRQSRLFVRPVCTDQAPRLAS